MRKMLRCLSDIDWDPFESAYPHVNRKFDLQLSPQPQVSTTFGLRPHGISTLLALKPVPLTYQKRTPRLTDYPSNPSDSQ